jgi:hypothetical protein
MSKGAKAKVVVANAAFGAWLALSWASFEPPPFDYATRIGMGCFGAFFLAVCAGLGYFLLNLITPAHRRADSPIPMLGAWLGLAAMTVLLQSGSYGAYLPLIVGTLGGLALYYIKDAD